MSKGRSYTHGQAYVDMEAEYVARRRTATPRAVTEALGISYSTAETLEKYFVAQTRAGSTDSSCPRFAHHGAHVERVIAAGGFPTVRALGAARVLVGPSGALWRPR